MGSASHQASIFHSLPTINLDTTMAELYKRASPSNASKRLAQVLCGVNCSLDLSPDFPRNTKFLYQDSPFTTKPRQELTRQNVELQKSLALKYLSLVPQRDGFISGKTPVVLFNVDQTEGQIAHDCEEAEATIAVLDETQRPELVFCPGPAKIPVKVKAIDKIAYKVALDGLQDYDLTVDMEAHWFLNSKAALALSGLPTPKAEVVEAMGFGQTADLCCEVCTTNKGDTNFIPVACTGERGLWLEQQMVRIISAIQKREVPFVVKNQQTFGGAGTWVVTTKEQKQELLLDLSGDEGVLRKLFSSLTESNYHLKPGSLIISDLVQDSIGDYGLTFFATDSGEAIFLAVSEQMIDDSNAWIGSTIDYTHQDRLHEKFASIMEKIAAWVSSHGYYGPVGADILETKLPGETQSCSGDSTGFHIVDLNVRTSGSICLPLLRTHFMSRGLNCGSSFSITVKRSREDFIESWKEEFKNGAMCILSWYEDKKTNESIADVAAGGENEKKLQELMAKVRDASEDITF